MKPNKNTEICGNIFLTLTEYTDSFNKKSKF